MTTIRSVLSFVAYGAAIVFFAAFFWRARGLGREASAEGREVDRARKRQLNLLLAAGVVALIAAALL